MDEDSIWKLADVNEPQEFGEFKQACGLMASVT